MTASHRYRCQLRQSAAERSAEMHPLTWRLREDNALIGLDEYIDKQGYAAVKQVLGNQSPDEVITTMKDANVRGRGGGRLFCRDEMEPDHARGRSASRIPGL